MRPSLMKLTRSLPPVSMLDQVPATVVCTGWFAPASARKNAAVMTSPVMARIEKNVVLVRRGRLVDWFNMSVIRFVLSLFVFVFCQAFAPDWLTVHRFLQRSRGEVTKYLWKSSRSATIIRSVAVCGAPAAARRNGERFRFHPNPLCRCYPLRLVLRTQPRSFGCGLAALRCSAGL